MTPAEPPPAPVPPSVEVTDLEIRLPDGPPLLAGTTLTLFPGRIVALTGPSGAGKTTLLRAIAGALPAGARRTSGRVTVLGHDVLALGEQDLRLLRRRRLAYVGQDPGSGLNPRMKVRRLIAETAVTRGHRAVRDLLTQVRLPADERLELRRPGALSGGQQRRVALARALARRPDVLLLDEPTAGLDPELRDEIADLLCELAGRTGVAVAVASHDPELVSRCAHDVVVLRPPAETVRRFLPAARVLDFSTADEATSATPPAAASVKPEADDTCASVPVATRPPSRTGRITVRDLSAVVGGRSARRTVLDNLDLDLAPGGATGVIGVSGSGKTTLVRVLTGLHPPSTGTVALDGAPLHRSYQRRTQEQRRALQLVPQNPLGALNPARTVGATLARPLTLHRVVPVGQVPARVAELLEAVDLPTDFAGRYPHQLSGGQRQRVSIARALAVRPDVLLCDEVTSALDADTSASIMDLLSRLRREHGVTLVLISHDLSMIAAHTDTTIVLENGRIIENGPTPGLFDSLSHSTSRTLIAGATMRREAREASARMSPSSDPA
ncbi:ABC transporter ATP-binding protein [Microtetraspora sp. AC03309]|uniref:ABC transporter ATP-binding protein n=1 Tax=Microtetraspora sp. AC03309 TaxID=2779376 RepID=UPI001E302957|nr:ATP-binding cassette domain-containing protein [Microtetraspora sp. AC03309]MCC5577473.1 ABC transporter ATP-binding protein [Microtetraspora sp. AC03309]